MTTARKPAKRGKRVGFEAALIEGHKRVHAVIVPFDPAVQWGPSIMIDARREGWLVHGTVNGVTFDGWIGHRWKKHFVIVDAALRREAKAAVGDTVELVIAPTTRPEALAVAQAQAKLTTAPGRGKRRAR